MFAVLFILTPVLCHAQKPSDFLPEKLGKWSYSTNIKTPEAEVAAFNKNLAGMAEWFHQNTPMLSSPKGFDLKACAYGTWDDHYKMSKRNYALRASMEFNFQLFYSAGGKWTIEPPHYEFSINSAGFGTGYSTFNNVEDDPSLEKAINEAGTKMNEVFVVFPLVKSLAPGVNYYDCEARTCGSLVVFNPERTPFWSPITLKELANIHLQYYKLKNKSELDRMLYTQLEKEIAELSEEELNAPAFSGHDTHFVLKANGKGEGLQFMRFNPDYWDRSLPRSSIQFLTFYYSEFKSKEEKDYAADEHFKNNGYPTYSMLLNDQVDWEKLAALIRK
jgi:hypothetical protein